MPKLIERYRAGISKGEIKPDPAQEAAAQWLQMLSAALKGYSPGRVGFFFRAKQPPRGLYIWGDVGRGKSMLMDLFFELAPVAQKTRIHFNAFMADTHARIHAERQRGEHDDPIPPVARAIAERATLLCFDEFQVNDVADAMILGRLFQQLFERGIVVVATSNIAPERLYDGGLNRQLFLPFIDLIRERLDILELTGPNDYRLQRMSGLDIYITPLGPGADAKMDSAWARLTDNAEPKPVSLPLLGRQVRVPCAAKGVARFSFEDLCAQPLGAVDYLEIARHFHTILIDRIPEMNESMKNWARRFTLLIDTLYDEGAKLICSAAVPPDRLYPEGDGSKAFQRTASRLVEMQSEDYLKRGHGIHGGA